MEGLLEALKQMIPEERIDGTLVSDAAEMVMLEIEFTPVVERFVREEELLHSPPSTCRVEQCEDGYALVFPAQHDFRRVSEEQLKTMRARYLLVRGYYYARLGMLSYEIRNRVLADYFPGGVYRPEAESALGKAMGIVA